MLANFVPYYGIPEHLEFDRLLVHTGCKTSFNHLFNIMG